MRAIWILAPIMVGSTAAEAANVTLSANLVNSCTLTVGTSGLMTAASDGGRIGSEESGGLAASLTVVSIGNTPTLNFSAPTLTSSPAGWSASPVISIRYTSATANQAYTSSASSATLSGLTDLFSIHGRVTSTSGFAAGSYTLQTVVTCSQ